MKKNIIQIINPNTSLSMTTKIGTIARKVTAIDTEIKSVCPMHGVSSIESHFDETIAALGVLEQIKEGIKQGVDGHIIACFGDPGLLAARELSCGPVVGIAEAAMHLATLIATRFSIITTLPRTIIITRQLLKKYSFTDYCASIYAIDLPVLMLEEKNEIALEKVRQKCINAKNKDGIGAIILGCSGMANFAKTLTLELNIPVVDGVTAAVKIVESLLLLGLNTSKYGDYAYPLKKHLSTKFQHLN